jgi:hypothetical protein
MDDKGKAKVGVLESSRSMAEHGAKITWSRPDPRWLKVNTDVGFDPGSGRASLGVMARDDRGKVVLAAWQGIGRCGSSEEAEAEACLKGVRFSAERFRQPISVEGDCLTLIKANGATLESRSSIVSIISEIRG